MKFHIIIPVYNNKEVTLECLRLLSIQTFTNFDIYVVDDGSEDETAQAIREKFPSVTVLESKGNQWWAGTMNMGLEHVFPLAVDEDYILTLNNDVTFECNYLENLVKAAQSRPNWLIGSTSINQYDLSVIDAGVYFDWKSRKETRQSFRAGAYFNDNINVLSGRGALIPCSVYKTIGMYEAKRLPQYAADYELAVRASRAGYNLTVYCDAVLFSDTQITGYKFTPFAKISIRQARELLFSNKSLQNIKTRFNYIVLCCPKRYICNNLTAELLNILLIISSIPPLWNIKILLRPIFERFFRRRSLF